VRSTLALAVATLAFATPAKATTVVAADGAPDAPYQLWANQIDRFMPTPDGDLAVNERACPWTAARACVFTFDGVQSFYFDPASATRGDFRHELGHIFDGRELTDADRGELTPLMKFAPGTDWHHGTEHATMPAEQFAEFYAYCPQLRWRDGRWRSNNGERRIGYGPRRVGAICDVIRRAASS
jgi:hypothetical protein